MKCYHIERELGTTINSQTRKLAKEYKGFQYLFSDGKQIHFIAEDKEEVINDIQSMRKDI